MTTPTNLDLRPVIVSSAIFLGFAVFSWASDFVTLKGERTIYTVRCQGGQWSGKRCTGKLAAGSRVRFRALRAHGEVLFWNAGVHEVSGRLTGCEISDGRNWSCPVTADATKSITLQMRHGRAVHSTAGGVQAYHAVTKWRWFLLYSGLSMGSFADD